MKNGLLLRNCNANCGCDLFICRLANFIDLTLSHVEISEVDTKMETKNCNYDWNVCSEVDAQLVENRKVDGVAEPIAKSRECWMLDVAGAIANSSVAKVWVAFSRTPDGRTSSERRYARLIRDLFGRGA